MPSVAFNASAASSSLRNTTNANAGTVLDCQTSTSLPYFSKTRSKSRFEMPQPVGKTESFTIKYFQIRQFTTILSDIVLHRKSLSYFQQVFLKAKQTDITDV